MEMAGSEQIVWKLLFFATFITLHISYRCILPNIHLMIRIPYIKFLATVDRP